MVRARPPPITTPIGRRLVRPGAIIAATIEASAEGTIHRPAAVGESPSTICRNPVTKR